MPQRNQEELKKVTQMVKEKNYNHKELGILKQEEIIRMKVLLISSRKLFENRLKRKKSLRKRWPKRKNNRSWL